MAALAMGVKDTYHSYLVYVLALPDPDTRNNVRSD